MFYTSELLCSPGRPDLSPTGRPVLSDIDDDDRVIDLRSMYLMEHVFECSVIVVGVSRRDFVGEERRRVQELHVGLDCGLVEVMVLGLITCGEEGLVRGVHTLVAGVVQVYHRLHVVEEEEKGGR